MPDLTNIIQRSFPQKRIVIAGDIVADQFLNGTIARVSREAPVFILRHDDTETLAGGAANAAVNVASLGGIPVLVGLAGEDQSGSRLLETLRSSNVDCRYIVTDPNLATTTKVRVLAGQHYAPRQQVIRIDYENTASISIGLRERLRQNLAAAAEGADAIIVSDYNYGVADADLAQTAREISREKHIPLLIDSRFRLREFPNATSATPNQEEVEQLLGKDYTPEECSQVCAELGLEALLVTCGNKGMSLFRAGQDPLHFPAVGSSQPVDVTGAGDTVIAVYALGLASGLSFDKAAHLANHAGGIVVMKRRTASVKPQELVDSIQGAGEAAMSDHA